MQSGLNKILFKKYRKFRMTFINKEQNNQAQEKSFQLESTSDETQLIYRDKLHDAFLNTPLPAEDQMFNLGLYTRSSLLVKFLVMNQLYERVKHIPGHIIELGVWWGQNMVLLENLRAIHEPFNKQRKIIGFDTFSGYPPANNTQPSNKDKLSEVWNEGSYSTSSNYKDYLDNLLKIHESNNVLGHQNGCHELVEGDVSITVPEYFEKQPHTMVALAYFDIGIYEPTVKALAAIKPHLMPGSVILLDELTWAESPGEAIAFKEVFSRNEYKIEKCEHYPSKSIVTIK
tara:strand:- start:4151 stop:5011 length:861 start_codon:yes stop_codon:yes gene_type:complete